MVGLGGQNNDALTAQVVKMLMTRWACEPGRVHDPLGHPTRFLAHRSPVRQAPAWTGEHCCKSRTDSLQVACRP